MKSEDRVIRIALVDDHNLLRDALANVIDNFNDYKVTLLAENGQEFIEKIIPGNLPDLVILDLNMPQLNGFETAKWIRNNYPEMLVMILTMYDSEIALLQLLQTGVRGFLKKDIHPMELRYAMESVINTGYYYSHNTTGRLVNLFKNDGLKSSTLNNIIINQNELSFLKLASTELTYKEIAVKMRISPRTIDNYRDALFIKLNVKSRVGLAMYAIKSGIVTLCY
jgi:two-component system, NarL family, invasion response regulator UvrY